LGIDKFVIEESFEDIFNSLKGAYYQKYLFEYHNTYDLFKANLYLNRSNEIARLKKTFNNLDWAAKRDAILIYKHELQNLNRHK